MIDPNKLLTPREYGRLLYQIFFKGRTLRKTYAEQTKDWTKKQTVIYLVRVHCYTFFLILATLSAVPNSKMS
ncbi:MAG: hypothetical protein B6244_00120 [Candidatus Cloacimonetes bacterium 4572_55]|nr:MAG: hypothetical protein B6244_00120 [Candidatus Cloacimonetes bacterium 4572_55]